MTRTIPYLQAELDRSRQQGARFMEVSLADMAEILRAAESHAMLEHKQSANKHAGWIKPGSLSALRSGKKLFTRISKRRSDEFNTEIFFAADLKEKKREAELAKVAKEIEHE